MYNEGYSGFQVTGVIKINGGKNQNPKKSLDQKLTSKKTPMVKLQALNISRKLKG